MKKRIKLYIYMTAILSTMMGYAQQKLDYSSCSGYEFNSTQYNDCKRLIDAYNFQIDEAKKLEAIAVAVRVIAVAQDLQSMGTTLLTTQTQIQSINQSTLQALIQASVTQALAAQYALDQARQAKIQAEQALALAQQELDMAREIAATGQTPQFSATQMAQTAAAEYTAQTVFYAQLATQQYGYATGQTTTSVSSTTPTWYMDYDGDGWHSISQQKSTPPGAFGWKSTTYGLDCNDNDPTKTYNCNTAPPPTVAWFLDKDGDGYFAAGQMAATSPGPGWTSTITKGPDCDDNDASKTTDCSVVGAVTPDPTPKTKWYYDGDGDGYVNGAIEPKEAETSPGAKWVKVTDGKDFDCDDTNPAIGNCKMETKDCTTEANTRGTETTTLLNSSMLQMPLAQFRDAANLAADKPESGMSIEKMADGTLVPFNYQLGTGTVSNATVATQATEKTIVAGIHTHTGGKVPGPSPQDIYHLMEGYKGNNNYRTDFNIAQNGNEYALVVNDSLSLVNFETAYPRSTNIDTASNKFLENLPLGEKYRDVMNIYYRKGFPKEDAHEMALVTVLDYLKAGVKLLKKDNGATNFKELSIEYIKDANGKILDIKIKKCN